jgi:hypothetical protein
MKSLACVQMEGVKVFTNDEWVEAGLSSVNYVEKDLKEALEGLARHLFGKAQLQSLQAALLSNFSDHVLVPYFLFTF